MEQNNTLSIKIFRSLSIILIILNLSALVLVLLFLPPVETITLRFHLPLFFSAIFSFILFFISKKGNALLSLFIILLTLFGPVSAGYFYTMIKIAEQEKEIRWQQMRMEATVEWRNENCVLSTKGENHELYQGYNLIVDAYSCNDKTIRYYQNDNLVQTVYSNTNDK